MKKDFGRLTELGLRWPFAKWLADKSRPGGSNPSSSGFLVDNINNDGKKFISLLRFKIKIYGQKNR